VKIYMYKKDIPKCCSVCPCCSAIEGEINDIPRMECLEKRLDICPIKSIEEYDRERAREHVAQVHADLTEGRVLQMAKDTGLIERNSAIKDYADACIKRRFVAPLEVKE